MRPILTSSVATRLWWQLNLWELVTNHEVSLSLVNCQFPQINKDVVANWPTDKLLSWELILTWCCDIKFSKTCDLMKYRIAGHFRDFCDAHSKRENKTRENFNTWTFAWKIGLVEIFARAFVSRQRCIAISNRQTTSYRLPREILRPLLARRR